jgi:hypothetical protein
VIPINTRGFSPVFLHAAAPETVQTVSLSEPINTALERCVNETVGV